MENNKGNSLGKGVLVYAIGTFGTKFLSFLIVPLYTHYIATSDMGVYDVLMATIGLLTPLITLQISDAAYKWLLNGERIDDYICATLQVLLINCSITVLLIILVDKFVSIPYCMYFALVLVLSRITQTLQKLLRGLRRQKLFAVSGIVYTIVFLTTNLLLIVVFKFGVNGLFVSAILANIVAVLFIIISESNLRQRIISKINIKLILSMLKYSIPLIPNYMNWWIINSSDKYIVNFFLGSSANGVLAISHKFPTLLQTTLGLFNNSWQDISLAKKSEDKKYNTIVFRKFYLFSFGLLFPLIPITKVFILLVMGSGYKASCNYVPFYYIGIVFQAFSSFYGVGYLKNGETKKAFSTSITGAIINAATNIVLVRFLGLQAAAISTFLGFLCMWLVRERQNKEILGISINWIEIIILSILSMFFSILSIIFGTKYNIILFVPGLFLFITLNFKLLASLLKRVLAVISKSRK